MQQVQRSNFQAVGAVAFGITCASNECKGLAFTERHCKIARTLQTDDLRVTKEYLIYMCAHAFTGREFEKIESEMLCSLRQGPVIPCAFSTAASQPSGARTRATESNEVCALTVTSHPRPADFVTRFARAAGLEPIESLSVSLPAASTFTRIRVLIFFLDVMLVSTQCLAHAARPCYFSAVMLSLRLLCPTVASCGDHDMHSRASADEIRLLTTLYVCALVRVRRRSSRSSVDIAPLSSAPPVS